jgi:hypothetical protein
VAGVDAPWHPRGRDEHRSDSRPAGRRRPQPRQERDLAGLLRAARTAALGTLDDEGAPFVSMVPFAVAAPLGCLVLHVSALAALRDGAGDGP